VRTVALRIGLAAWFVLAWADHARSTTVIRLDTPGLVRSSSDIVVGTVESARCRWDDSHTRILTEVTVHVTRSLKGENQRLTLLQWGGELDGMRYTIPGSPTFHPGEEALLFVWRDRHGRPQVNGLAQGKFDIRRDQETGEALVERSLPGLAVRDAHTLRTLRAGEAAPRITLGRMLDEIQRSLEEAGR
jgi:hypothetical protein